MTMHSWIHCAIAFGVAGVASMLIAEIVRGLPRNRERGTQHILLMGTVSFAVFLLCVGYCLTQATRAKAQERIINIEGNAASVRAQILHLAPVGSSIAHAQAVMEQGGFTCKSVTHDDFVGLRDANFLYCGKEYWIGAFVSQRWQVAIVDKHGRVSEVLVTSAFTGP